MTTSWTRNAGSVATEGLQILGVASAGQPVNAEDLIPALDALDAVLKELPLYGYAWPQLTAEASLVWDSLTPSAIVLPTDFYGYPVVWANGVKLNPIKHTDWLDLNNRSQSATTAYGYYVFGGTLYLYPVPQTDPVLTIQYQRIVDDVVSGSALDMPQWWFNALGYGVANELLFKYGIPEPMATKIERRWEQKKAIALGNSVSNDAISFSVDDGPRPWGPGNWQAPVPIPDGYDAGGEP